MDPSRASRADSGRQRDDLRVVGRETRAFIERALEIGGVRDRRARVLLAAIALTATWSKVADRVTLGQIAALASIPGDTRDDPRHAKRALHELDKLDVLAWTPGTGRGRAGTLSLVPVAAAQRPLLAVVRETLADSVAERGADSGGKGGLIRTEKGGRTGPPPEKVSEKVPDDVDEDRFQALVARLSIRPPLDEAGRLFAQAPTGSERLADEALRRPGVRDPAGWWLDQARRGEHRRCEPRPLIEHAMTWAKNTAPRLSEAADVPVVLTDSFPALSDDERTEVLAIAVRAWQARRA